MCEQVVKLLIEDDLVRELFPLDEWRIDPSTEARGKILQHERRLWVNNDLNAWHIAKLRQHAQDPTNYAGRLGFEGGFVSRLNSSFAELLRRLIRGGGRTPEEILERERESPGLHKALALNRDLKEKAPMSLQDQPTEAEDADL